VASGVRLPASIRTAVPSNSSSRNIGEVPRRSAHPRGLGGPTTTHHNGNLQIPRPPPAVNRPPDRHTRRAPPGGSHAVEVASSANQPISYHRQQAAPLSRHGRGSGLPDREPDNGGLPNRVCLTSGCPPHHRHMGVHSKAANAARLSGTCQRAQLRPSPNRPADRRTQGPRAKGGRAAQRLLYFSNGVFLAAPGHQTSRRTCGFAPTGDVSRNGNSRNRLSPAASRPSLERTAEVPDVGRQNCNLLKRKSVSSLSGSIGPACLVWVGLVGQVVAMMENSNCRKASELHYLN
jgi:hypothetical protein